MDIKMPNNLSGSQTMGYLKASSHSLFEVFLLIIFIGLFYWFIVMPKKHTLDTVSQQLSKTQQDQKALAASVDKLRDLIAQLHAHYQDFDRLDQALPLDGSAIRFELLLKSLGQASGVILGDVGINGDNGGVAAGNKALLDKPFNVQRTVHNLTANVSAVGNYDQLTLFLQKLEQDARIINITSLTISGYNANQLSLRASLEAYYYAP